ncbi:unnamed protein product, partial [Amoebophrya sp. A120]|eukprot:GSA120T00015781001.1
MESAFYAVPGDAHHPRNIPYTRNNHRQQTVDSDRHSEQGHASSPGGSRGEENRPTGERTPGPRRTADSGRTSSTLARLSLEVHTGGAADETLNAEGGDHVGATAREILGLQQPRHDQQVGHDQSPPLVPVHPSRRIEQLTTFDMVLAQHQPEQEPEIDDTMFQLSPTASMISGGTTGNQMLVTRGGYGDVSFAGGPNKPPEHDMPDFAEQRQRVQEFLAASRSTAVSQGPGQQEGLHQLYQQQSPPAGTTAATSSNRQPRTSESFVVDEQYLQDTRFETDSLALSHSSGTTGRTSDANTIGSSAKNPRGTKGSRSGKNREKFNSQFSQLSRASRFDSNLSSCPSQDLVESPGGPSGSPSCHDLEPVGVGDGNSLFP